MPIFNRVTIRDMAARIGVSHVTVSLALRDSTRISLARRNQVQKLAREMGYRPDPILSSLIAYRYGKRPSHIQNALAWINHWEHPEGWRKIKDFEAYWRGASNAAERCGYRLDEFVWRPEFTAQRFETILQTRNIRGVLIPPHPSQPDWGNLNWDNFSVIRFGLSVISPHSHVVTSDHLRSIVSSVEKIHSYGYKRIGFVLPADFDLRSGGSYTGGFIAAQRMFGLAHCLPALLTSYNLTNESFQTIFKHWLNKNKPDAILTVDKRILSALKQFGLRIPEDIAVAAATIHDIPLDAGVDQNSEEIGRIASETLIALINANERGKPIIPRRILIEGSWVDGSSLPNLNLNAGMASQPMDGVGHALQKTEDIIFNKVSNKKRLPLIHAQACDQIC
jgi:LacI family transcriptional regulator